MPTNKTKITDSELIEQIAASHLREDQKKDLSELVGEMTEEERSQLIALIEESNKAANDFENKKKEKLSAINKEYIQKLDEAAHQESEYIRSEFEKFDEKQSAGEMKKVEAEIATAAKTEAEMQAESKLKKVKKIRHHPIFKLFITLLILAGVIYGILYGLQYLNTL